MWGRALKLAIICIVLGAVTTVAVAWGSALWISVHHPMGTSNAVHAGDDSLAWFVSRWERAGVVRIKSHWFAPFHGASTGWTPSGPVQPLIPSWATFLIRPEYGGPGPSHKERILECRGWPALALWCGEEATYVGGARSQPIRTSDAMIRGIRLSPGWHTYSDGSTVAFDRCLPLGILWRGFAIDTAAYSIGLFAVLTSVWIARGGIGKWRLSRGRCAKCGYPIGISPVCSECGVELPALMRFPARTSGRG